MDDVRRGDRHPAVLRAFGTSFVVSFIVAVTVVTLYPLVGGIVAGIRTEVFQGAIMIVGSVLVIVFAGLLSAILSTASIFLNVGSAALTRDIPLSLGRPPRNPVLWARLGTAALALLSGILALWSRELIALLGAVGYGLHAAALVPTLALGLRWGGATAAGVVASTAVAIVGSVYFFIAQQLGFASSHGWWTPAHGFPSVGFVLLLSLIAFIVVSLATTPPRAADPSP